MASTTRTTTGCPTESCNVPDCISRLTHDTLLEHLDAVASEPDLAMAKEKIGALYASTGRASYTARPGDARFLRHAIVTGIKTCYNVPLTAARLEPWISTAETQLIEHGYKESREKYPGFWKYSGKDEYDATKETALMAKFRRVFEKRDVSSTAIHTEAATAEETSPKTKSDQTIGKREKAPADEADEA